MLRKILMLCPALAFALPLLAAGPSMARPLSIPAQPAEWCWGDDDCGDFGEDLLLAVCVQTQIFVQTGEHDRAYECDTLTGPTCLASCAGETGDAGAACRSQCDGAGALFCAPSDLKARWGGFNDDDDDDDDHHDEQDNLVFINTETCLELNLEDQ
ncbi:hypothetical protein SAMN02745121_03114 [Nannocystis exedens]|uniref:CVNH domain-containing protein n=1 Tax=Nannocystis exedens TaxID=54 RepID=A0A1I1Y2I6_9BACT|nr:hypothetical protein [Nannocystis exedens]PCC71762.1 hypothetical protein NAEX_04841 [Nannocystis exedens]SFE13619.1 hypothetical protein SAMN02745121_03114 [Nannocystis exedens]